MKSTIIKASRLAQQNLNTLLIISKSQDKKKKKSYINKTAEKKNTHTISEQKAINKSWNANTDITKSKLNQIK